MANEEHFCLCGGTFFTLLTRAMNPATRSTTTAGVTIEGINNTTLMKALVKLYNPGANYFPENFTKFVSEYRSCGKDSSTYINFSDKLLADAFAQKMQSEFPSLMNKMSQLTEKFINKEAKGQWLIRALIELIDSDENIDADRVIYVRPDGSQVTVHGLGQESEFCLEVLLLYLLLYIGKDAPLNTEGQATYNSWYVSQGDGTLPVYVGTIGDNEERQVSLVDPALYTKPLKKQEKVAVATQKTPIVEPGSGFDYADYLNAAKKKHGQIKTI